MGKTVRVLVIDLDNTMWGGVLGEDGIDGVKIAGDYPGNAFLAFQRALAHAGAPRHRAGDCQQELYRPRAQDDRRTSGHGDKERRYRRPSDQLEPEIFEHPRNLRRVEPWTGLVLFIDDHPVERRSRQAATCSSPSEVLDLPPDPGRHTPKHCFRRLWLGVISVTAEDLKTG